MCILYIYIHNEIGKRKCRWPHVLRRCGPPTTCNYIMLFSNLLVESPCPHLTFIIITKTTFFFVLKNSLPMQMPLFQLHLHQPTTLSLCIYTINHVFQYAYSSFTQTNLNTIKWFLCLYLYNLGFQNKHFLQFCVIHQMFY